MADQHWPQLVAEAWAELDRDAPDGDGGPAWPGRLRVTGPPGQLPSRLPVEDLAVACVGTALLAAAALADGRGRRELGLDRRQVAAAVRSEALVRVNGQRAGGGFAPLSRFWRTADGWVRTHANYPWHREALLRVLGCAGEPDAVAAALARLDAAEVEDRVTAAGGVAAAVRAEAAWRASPAGQAVARARLVEGVPGEPAGRDGVHSIEGAPPRRRALGSRAPGSGPAAGIRVLDLTRVIAGPVATRYLGALGADVLRLDPPGRPELPQQTYDQLLGKRSAVLDFGTPDGLGRLHELLSGADVLIHGYRPHALDRFGLAPPDLAERHPGLVVVSLSAWGRDGPWGQRRGFDSIVQAASGIAVIESADGEQPGALPCQILDHGTGYLCAATALRALAAQAAYGGTLFRELSLARTGLWLLGQPRDGRSEPAAGGDPAAWLATVDGADGPVTAVRPPGRLDGDELSWPAALSGYGRDPAAWRPGPDTRAG
jgi:crotonobetainyl-CoA:carnitine CoA-transferase CaiB-like acyl-CoA transferase